MPSAELPSTLASDLPSSPVPPRAGGLAAALPESRRQLRSAVVLALLETTINTAALALPPPSHQPIAAPQPAAASDRGFRRKVPPRLVVVCELSGDSEREYVAVEALVIV